MCMTFGCNAQINFCHFWPYSAYQFLSLFCSSDLIIFGLKAFRRWISCECNSSYSFTPIFLKLCICFCQGLEMCMTFGCNPQMNFCYFFCSSDLNILSLKHWDTGYLVNASAPIVSSRSFLNVFKIFNIYIPIKEATKHRRVIQGHLALLLWLSQTFWQWHEISNNVVCATSKGSDQPAQMLSLIRAFASHLNILWLKLLNEHHLESLSLKGGCTG